MPCPQHKGGEGRGGTSVSAALRPGLGPDQFETVQVPRVVLPTPPGGPLVPPWTGGFQNTTVLVVGVLSGCQVIRLPACCPIPTSPPTAALVPMYCPVHSFHPFHPIPPSSRRPVPSHHTPLHRINESTRPACACCTDSPCFTPHTTSRPVLSCPVLSCLALTLTRLSPLTCISIPGPAET
jgi:hypothetical protein